MSLRISLGLALILPTLVAAQSPEQTKATIKYIDALRDPDTAAWAVTAPKAGEKLKPSLRACNGAVKATRALGGTVTDIEKVQTFVLSCYDETAGTFAEPGDKPNVTITAIGVITAVEVGIAKEKLKPAMLYLGKAAREFEDVRLGAAAVEAYGFKDCPFDVAPWLDVCSETIAGFSKETKRPEVRSLAGVGVAVLRMPKVSIDEPILKAMKEDVPKSQFADGGWGKGDSKTSDQESTYRVMRLLMMLKMPPQQPEKLKEFLASCRRDDGGYGVDAKAPSSMSGVYYAAMVNKWLGETEKK